MEAGFIAMIVIAAVICVLAVVYVVKTKTKRQGIQGIQGTLNIDCSDPESYPYLYLSLDVPISEVASQKRASFDVNVIRHNSQK